MRCPKQATGKYREPQDSGDGKGVPLCLHPEPAHAFVVGLRIMLKPQTAMRCVAIALQLHLSSMAVHEYIPHLSWDKSQDKWRAQEYAIPLAACNAPFIKILLAKPEGVCPRGVRQDSGLSSTPFLRGFLHFHCPFPFSFARARLGGPSPSKSWHRPCLPTSSA